MVAPLNGSWYWCHAHQVPEFIPRKDDVVHCLVGGHDYVGPYPTSELAEEFGQTVWGPSEPDN